MAKEGAILAVVVVSYNTREITDKCVELVERAAGEVKRGLKKDVEIVVVDNGSTDGSGEMISKKYPQVELIETGKNLGYAGGNNLGMAKTTAKYIVLLNSDAWIKTETLVETINYFDKHKQVDVLGCRLRFADGRLQPSAGFLPTGKNIAMWLLGGDKVVSGRAVHPTNKDFFGKTKQVEWVMGAFLALRREVYVQTGGLDEHFFMYLEEVEWCYRMKQKGFTVWYVPEWEITHLDKASSSGDVKRPIYLEMTGLVYLVQRHEPNSWWWVRPVMGVGNWLRMIGWYMRGRPEMAKVYREILKKI